MGLFGKKKRPVSADGYEREIVAGYTDKGKVAKMLADGWEIESTQPVVVGGTTVKQARYHLRRKVA